MATGLTLRLYDGSTAQASLTGIRALWWDTVQPSGRPKGQSTTVSTDGDGDITLDLSSCTGLGVGEYGFLQLYRLDGTDHEDSLTFAGKVITSTVSGGDLLSAAEATEWKRNPSWLALPSVTSSEQKVVGLYRVDKGSTNYIAFTCAANYTVDWGDGTAPENVATGVSAEHLYSYSDSDLDGTDGPVTFTDSGDLVGRTAHGYLDGGVVQFFDIVSTTGLVETQSYYVVNAATNTFQVSATLGGSALTLTTDGSAKLLNHKQVVVTITPQASNNLTSIDFNDRHSATSVVYSTGWLDLLVSGPNLTTLIVSASTQLVRWGYLKQFQLISTNSITDMSYFFNNCVALVSVPLLNTSAATNMSGFFAYCNSLVSIPLLDTSAATNMSFFFNSCNSLVSIPLLDTSAATNMSFFFSSCASLASIPLLNTSAATNMSYFFNGCVSLASAPALNFTGVVSTALTNLFGSCVSLQKISAININLSFSIANCKLGAAELDELYTNLPTVTSKTITVTGNPGVSGDTPSIATAKGWTVTG